MNEPLTRGALRSRANVRSGAAVHVDRSGRGGYKAACDSPSWPHWRARASGCSEGCGLGGAEFGLPLLVALFGYALRLAIPLNLAISFVAVVIAAPSRWLLAGQAPLPSAVPVAVAMMAGAMIGAAIGARWLAHVSDARLHGAVRSLLVGIGALLIVESLGWWTSPGLPFGCVGPGARRRRRRGGDRRGEYAARASRGAS